MYKHQVLNRFWIRIIALSTMVIDHLAMLLYIFDVLPLNSFTYFVLRLIGRLSFPLFALGIVEGIIHTKNLKKYILRLSVMTLFVGGGIIFVEQILHFNFGIEGNIFITLLLGAISIALLKRKDFFSIFVLLPLSYSLLMYFDILPSFLIPQFGIYGVLLIISMFVFRQLGEKIFCSSFEEKNINTGYSQQVINLSYIFALIVVNVMFYIIKIPKVDYYLNIEMQDYSIISSFIVILYNANKGYDSKWFRILSYLFYPLHIILLYVLCFLLFM